mmetsp:Transcript_21518/g.32844  ORF Transcript_21518/g.32844 Transcript_21518/m.32844 type:complete len:244 (-) Transcript_21518:2458-3189(-)
MNQVVVRPQNQVLIRVRNRVMLQVKDLLVIRQVNRVAFHLHNLQHRQVKVRLQHRVTDLPEDQVPNRVHHQRIHLVTDLAIDQVPSRVHHQQIYQVIDLAIDQVPNRVHHQQIYQVFNLVLDQVQNRVYHQQIYQVIDLAIDQVPNRVHHPPKRRRCCQLTPPRLLSRQCRPCPVVPHIRLGNRVFSLRKCQRAVPVRVVSRVPVRRVYPVLHQVMDQHCCPVRVRPVNLAQSQAPVLAVNQV